MTWKHWAVMWLVPDAQTETMWLLYARRLAVAFDSNVPAYLLLAMVWTIHAAIVTALTFGPLMLLGWPGNHAL